MTRWIVLPTAEDAATTAAGIIAEAARAAVRDRGRFTLALSGGTTPLRMLGALGRYDLPWSQVWVHQVDERVAPPGDPARNLTALAAALPAAANLVAMPVEQEDLEAAAAACAAALPARFDLVQLGIGDDGHTASLVPGQAVLDVIDRDVAVTDPYRGHRRMTLTYPVLDRARTVLWLATGAAKRGPLAQLRAGDPAIPAGRVHAPDQVVVCDEAAGRNGRP